MRYALAFLVLASSTASAASPKVSVKAPALVSSGATVRFDITGTVSDSQPQIRVWTGPDNGEPHYTATGELIGYELDKPGDYVFAVVASGKSDASSPITKVIDFCLVKVSDSQPAPLPTPPKPTPNPSPQDNSPFSTAYRDYSTGMSSALGTISAGVRSGKITSKQQFIAVLSTHSNPFEIAIDDLFKANIDASGIIANPGVIADALDRAVKGSP